MVGSGNARAFGKCDRDLGIRILGLAKPSMIGRLGLDSEPLM